MAKIEKIRDDLYVKKDIISGYRVVHPVKKDIDKPFALPNIHWFNLLTGGTWFNVVKAFGVLALVIVLVWSYNHDVQAYKDVAYQCIERPCEWCSLITSARQQDTNLFTFNMTAVQEAIRGLNKSG